MFVSLLLQSPSPSSPTARWSSSGRGTCARSTTYSTRSEGELLFLKKIKIKCDIPCFFRGKFGKVLKCVSKESGQTFAAKFVMCSTREDRRNVEREVVYFVIIFAGKLV